MAAAKAEISEQVVDAEVTLNTNLNQFGSRVRVMVSRHLGSYS